MTFDCDWVVTFNGEIHTATYLLIFVKITLISASVLCTAEERHSNVRSHECTKIRAYTSNAVRSTSDATSIHTDNTHVFKIQNNFKLENRFKICRKDNGRRLVAVGIGN